MLGSMSSSEPNLLVVPVSERDHIQGSLDAPMTLVEYGDFQCPYCGAAYPIVKEVQRTLRDRLAFVFRHFPIVGAHPYALIAAEAAEAAGAQDRFWPMHDRLFEHQDALDPQSLVRHAAALDLDLETFVDDLETHRHVPRIEADMDSGARSGVLGTPTFFVNGVHYFGGYDAAGLIAALTSTAHVAR
jgi:protein-disulfide isomerase